MVEAGNEVREMISERSQRVDLQSDFKTLNRNNYASPDTFDLLLQHIC